MTAGRESRRYGAEIIVHGRDIGEAKEKALQLAKERNLVYVNGYDDPRILAGQGTAGLEVVSQMEKLGVDCDAVIIPVGGGGLLGRDGCGSQTLYTTRGSHRESTSLSIIVSHEVSLPTFSTLPIYH